jgi:hypothetical protein
LRVSNGFLCSPGCAAKARAQEQGFKLGKSVGHFRANSKALAEGEPDGAF